MKTSNVATALLAGAFVTGCAVPTTPMAPGAMQVTITRLPQEVQTCTAAGNVVVGEGPYISYDSVRNQAIGVGGDTVLDTTPSGVISFGDRRVLSAGVIYRCRK